MSEAINVQRKYCVSNIAWPKDDDDKALDLIVELGFSGVEIAPVKVFGALSEVHESDVRLYREKLEQLGLSASAMQAILFGALDARLFGTPEEERALYSRLLRVAELAGWLGVKACVFGAPALRDPGDLPLDSAVRDARRFFQSIGPAYAERGSSLCFEANPEIYNCRFVTHTLDALSLVLDVSSPGFGLQFDAGTYFANNEAKTVTADVLAAANHFHISEPHLVPIGSSGVDHAQLGELLLDSSYKGWVSIEMRASDDWQHAIRDAAKVLEAHYGKR